MATILLSAAGAAFGAGFGGTVLGLSGAVIGRAIGATIGRSIDQSIMGVGSEAVETGRVERFRLMGASEGTAVAKIWGRVRVSGQVIWATKFHERVTRSGGKGTPQPKTSTYSYTVSVAIALCEGTISRVGRVWADGNEIKSSSVDLRVYFGSETQLPDPKIEAVEGIGNAPSYRGIAYVVIENLDLSAYGNRVPQFSFEVIRPAQGVLAASHPDLSKTINGVCLIPGSGEYALATTKVHFSLGPGVHKSVNVNSASGETDFSTSLGQLRQELPLCQNISLVVSWFGSDLRCGLCQIQPKVEQSTYDSSRMPWVVNGLNRSAAEIVPQISGKPIYGGSPADRSVVEAIEAIRDGGQAVTFYPFILMDQLAGNALADPWSAAVSQPALPWRGRITLENAPGTAGTNDGSAAAALEVSAFFGTAQPADFAISGQAVQYSGPEEWGFRRFILHYAKLCVLAGGVESFCIGSELRSLLQIRGAADSFPAVSAMRQLAADVRSILGPTTKISYAADWSEYFGYHVGEDVFFHLDDLWSDPAINFVGIDNYMPVSDWRDGEDHTDSFWGDVHNPGYLRANIAGGEGYDWSYDGPEGEAAQLRKPIAGDSYGEDWVFRYKDLTNWWQNQHFNRIGGVRSLVPTAWVPKSKPFRFTEYGCAALDKGTNQPNRFLDAKSSESGLPKFSRGQRDDLVQLAYFEAHFEHWADPANNQISPVYGAEMVDFANSTAWAWDARPYPEFPGNNELWSDAENYDKGHWLNGRSSSQPLAAVIAEICEASNIEQVDLSEAYGLLRGFSVNDVSAARSMLQPLAIAYGIDAVERDGMLKFKKRNSRSVADLSKEEMAVSSEMDGVFESGRAADLETPSRVRLAYFESGNDFSLRSVEAIFPDETNGVVTQSELPLVLTSAEATAIAERWMAEARVSKDTARFSLPRSKLGIGAGDIVSIEEQRYRVDRIEQSDLQMIEAVRIDANLYESTESEPINRGWIPFLASLPVFPVFLDLPLLTGTEIPYAPHVCAAASPWPNTVSVWSSVTDDGYVLNKTLTESAVIGLTENELHREGAGHWDRGPALRVRIERGELASVSEMELLSGANVAAIGDGASGFWEVFQFSQADLVGPKTYELSLRLRGQAGSDGIVPPIWPAGSLFVLINPALLQIDLPISARGLERYYRIGPSSDGTDGDGVVLKTEAFAGIGLRPYSVSHLTATRTVGTDIDVTWIRRTRLDGDSWQSTEVPMGEDSEAYLIRVIKDAVGLREETVLTQLWTYTEAMQIVDTASGAIQFSVAQISQSFGPGPFQAVEMFT